jgi:flagellar hook assembly protein FlgD
MKRIRPLIVVAVLAVIAPGTANAQDVRIVARDVPLAAARASVARPAPLDFNMVGIHWRGSGRVWFRTAARPGEFSPWHPAQPEEEDAPDPGSDELARSAESVGWHVGNPWWTDDAAWIEYRISGSVTGLRTYFVDSPVNAADRASAASFRTATATATEEEGPVPPPPIVRRAGWNADESIVRGAPSYAARLRFATVHHTAGSNSYSRSESAAIVRGIQRYHVLSNRWDDIGYNFLVDKYGRIFEGRGGGISRNVIGAHAGGFNTGSVGVAVIGIYQSASLPTAARNALQRLLAWRLDVGHVFPRGKVDTISAGSSRWPVGTHVRLRAVSGHRDTSLTSCPGNTVYAQLGTIARRVTRIGLPKLWNPEAAGAVGGPVRFTARLSSARPWTVEVKDAVGTVIARRSGSSAAVDWTWDATAVPPAYYTYTIRAGASVRPSTLPVPGPPPLAVTGLKVSPKALTPNGDWSGERTRVRFALNRRASLGVRVLTTSGTLVRTLLARAVRPAGARSLSWNGTAAGGTPVADGRYRIEIFAEAGVEAVSRRIPIVVDRTLGGVFAAPRAISPNGDGHVDDLEIGYELTRSATVRVQIRRKSQVLRRLVRSSAQAAGAYAVDWDGLAKGARVADGTATAVVLATTSLGTRKLTRPIRLDTRPPAVRVLSLRMVQGVSRLRLSLSESARLRIWYGRETWRDGTMVVVDRPAGVSLIRRRVRGKVVRIVAQDSTFNRSRGVIARTPRT